MADLTHDELLALARAAMMKIPEEDVEHLTPVSYTHLTLPTICSV